MKSNLVIIILLISLSSFAQKKSEIVQHGIETKRFFEQNIKDGDDSPVLIKEEYYDLRGDLVEIKEFENNGKDIKTWFKYTYDYKDIIEEIELNSKGEQKERIVYKYNKGLRIEKLTYDSKNRLEKRRTYEYGVRK